MLTLAWASCLCEGQVHECQGPRGTKEMINPVHSTCMSSLWCHLFGVIYLVRYMNIKVPFGVSIRVTLTKDGPPGPYGWKQVAKQPQSAMSLSNFPGILPCFQQAHGEMRVFSGPFVRDCPGLREPPCGKRPRC